MFKQFTTFYWISFEKILDKKEGVDRLNKKNLSSQLKC